MARKAAQDTLNKVLYELSNEMKTPIPVLMRKEV